MTRIVCTTILILIIAIFGAGAGRAQTPEPSQTAAHAPMPAASRKFVSKDPDYLKLLHPPEGNDFFKTYSKSYREKSEEIEAKIAGISDDNLRNQARQDEWAAAHKSEGDKFQYEADLALREARLAFAEKHRDGLLEIGRIAYDENNSVLAIAPIATAPIDAALRIPMKPATLNEIYAKFHELMAAEIDRKAHDYVANAGPGSNCAKNADWCYTYAKQDIEQRMRADRIVVAAQGDIEAMRIDRLLMADYVTEAILFELDGPAQGLAAASWRFSVGPVPTPPVEHAAAPDQAEPAESATAPPMGASGSANPPDARVTVPANVTAASILTQTTPEYPAEARAKNIQGEVVLHATIDKAGNISETQVLSGDDLLAKAAVEAVRQWKYKPMLVDGEAKEVDTIITVTFSLKD